jgi:hypothetical protein
VSLCILCDSVVKISRKNLTTEAQRLHRDTEKDPYLETLPMKNPLP